MRACSASRPRPLSTSLTALGPTCCERQARGPRRAHNSRVLPKPSTRPARFSVPGALRGARQFPQSPFAMHLRLPNDRARVHVAKDGLDALPASPPVLSRARSLSLPFLCAPITAERFTKRACWIDGQLLGLRGERLSGAAIAGEGASPRRVVCHRRSHSSAIAHAFGPSGPHGTERKPRARILAVGSQNPRPLRFTR